VIYFAIPGGLFAALLVLFVAARRRRVTGDGIPYLGTVSSRWLIEHRGGH